MGSKPLWLRKSGLLFAQYIYFRSTNKKEEVLYVNENFFLAVKKHFQQEELPEFWLLQPNVVNIVRDHLVMNSDNIFYPQFNWAS